MIRPVYHHRRVLTQNSTRDPELARALKLAIAAARAAGAILKRHWHDRDFEINSKGRNNPVTSADLEADRLIAGILRAAFPDYGWLSEETEDDKTRLTRSRVWIVDPLDGTKEFISGVPEFSIAIALAEEGEPVLGVTYNPVRREMFSSARGMGCYLNRRRVRVSRTRTLRRATVLASRSESSRGEWEVFHGQLKVSPTGSVAYKLAMVAAGMGDATFTRLPKNEWDIAAGTALILEAGGCVTNLDARPIRFNQPNVKLPGLIASNRLLFPSLAQLAGATPTTRALQREST
ncbi:MAG: 3'(2'),5'-bisphosphate nucleotidase CysQ [Candidatus Binataceae bacterium]|nr:3'(2'),5'-bisphosphate nucleotidase CysQ [Candidatus Binataceae bacterium]